MEESQFRTALSLYESKNYKKALTALEKILKKDQLHSQSYALKALVLTCFDPSHPATKNVNALHNVSKETITECEELITNAQKYGRSNSVTAHLTALYYKQIKNYEKAAYYFTVTFSNNPANTVVLRDLSSCLSQLRAYNSLKKTRFDYLQAEPGYRQNYSATAVAYDLNGEHENAVKICDQIEEIIKDKLIDEDMSENSECIIYKATLFIKLGQHDKALAFIDEQLESDAKFRCFDIYGLLELKYNALMKMDRLNDAQLVIRKLLKRNPDNLGYYNDLIKCLKIEDKPDLKLKVFEKLAKFYPKSDLPKFLPLTFLQGDQFITYLRTYLSGLFKRGVPSVFSNIKPLYKNVLNHKAILEVVESFESTEENPLVLTWIKYFISQHYYKLNDYQSSIEKIEEGIKITPTLIELYMFKARIYKKQGKLLDACDEMNTARLMDLQDRFVNTKTAKYYLRANKIDEALEIASLFTKNEEAKTGLKDLHSVQCCSFISEYAEALTRLFKENLSKLNELSNKEAEEGSNENIHLIKKQTEAYLGLSLQRYFSIFSIYAEYYEDQVDFHYYCFRKGVLRSYLEMIDWADELYHQPFIGRIYSDLMSLVVFTISNIKSIEEVMDDSTTIAKRSKKDKKEEGKWKDHMIEYHEVFSDDVFGKDLVNTIIVKKDYSKLQIIESLISRKDGKHEKPETLDFLNGTFNFDFISGKYVVALASVRKIKALTVKNNEDGEKAKVILESMLKQINQFLEEPVEDPKIQSLQKILKLGLARL